MAAPFAMVLKVVCEGMTTLTPPPPRPRPSAEAAARAGRVPSFHRETRRRTSRRWPSLRRRSTPGSSKPRVEAAVGGRRWRGWLRRRRWRSAPPISERSVSSGSCHVPVIAASGPPLDAPLRVIATARTRIGRFGGVGHAVTQSVLQDRNDGIGILECTCHAASLGVEIVPTSVATAQDQQQLGGRRQGGSGLARSSGSGSWSRDGLSGLARSSGSGSWSRDGLSGGEGGAGVSRQASGGEGGSTRRWLPTLEGHRAT